MHQGLQECHPHFLYAIHQGYSYVSTSERSRHRVSRSALTFTTHFLLDELAAVTTAGNAKAAATKAFPTIVQIEQEGATFAPTHVATLHIRRRARRPAPSGQSQEK